jgi:hypothetical protein
LKLSFPLQKAELGRFSLNLALYDRHWKNAVYKEQARASPHTSTEEANQLIEASSTAS